mmetsp:Transcript_20978/g.59498  ORF Transcript_20978/g.59498 Transcript_20978/m.59498 type:complete len:89 (+) Transcript_20978:1598-1864(+)
MQVKRWATFWPSASNNRYISLADAGRRASPEVGGRRQLGVADAGRCAVLGVVVAAELVDNAEDGRERTESGREPALPLADREPALLEA